MELEEVPASQEAEIHRVLPLEAPEQSDEEDFKELGLDTWGEADADDLASLPVPETEDNNNDSIFEETKDILNKDQDYLDELVQESVDDDKDLDKIIEETNKLLAESDDAFDTNDYDNSDEQDKNDEGVDAFNENDTPEKIYKDLNDDLDKLFETLDKLRDDNSDENEKSDKEVVDDVKDYEEKYDKPYNEGVALSWRNAEVDAAESADAKQNDETADEHNDGGVDENVVSGEDGADDDYENIDDSNLSQIFADNSDALNENADNDEQELVELDVNNEESVKETTAAPLANNDEIIDYADNYDDPSDSEPNADDDIDSVVKQIFADDVKPQLYGNDALVDEKQSKEENAEEFDTKTTNVEEETTQKSVMIEDLNNAQLDDLMVQFAAAHKDELDVNSENFAKHVKPIHMTLSADEPTVITSPDYPENYSPNNIIDWILEGPGTGIELNITDLALNSAMGDYLLVKPGKCLKFIYYHINVNSADMKGYI